MTVAAVLTAVGVVAGEMSDRTFARRKADAARSRLPAAPEQTVRLRW